MKAVLCPVCKGTGKVPLPAIEQTTSSWETICHGCGGKGWVEVKE